MNPYASNKALCHPDRLAALQTGKQPAPVHLIMLPVNGCNNSCTFCAYRQPDYVSAQRFVRSDIMPSTKAVEILGDASAIGVKAGQFTGGGEPTLHPDWQLLIQVSLALGLEVSLVTNGSKLGGTANDLLLECSWIRISWDAGCVETHNRTHRPATKSDFDFILKATADIVAARNAAKSNLYVGVGFVVARENWQDIPLAVKLAKEIGVDNLRIAAAFTNEAEHY